MNRRHLRMGAISALAALTLGVTGTTAAQATTHRETAPATSVAEDIDPAFDLSTPGAWADYLDTPEGQELLKEEGLTKQEALTAVSGDGFAAKGFLDKLKKKALKKAFKALPDSWQKKLTDWAKKGKGYFKEKWSSLPGWVKKTLTLGGAISAKTAIEWIIDLIL
ncbi:hypothetical protein ACFY3O_01165 [Streptomyces sp. NPDC001046]|uniref:hypothetical protein n=1 Tax=unclassified Streptomyces TaxID=2593676 RepID=UPI0036AD9D47